MSAAESTAQPLPTWPAEYVICVRGHIDPTWSEWLDNLAVVHTASGDTLLSGQVIDASALRSLLSKIFDLNLLLLLVERIETP
jgi:hypothetical protein